jgi:predicted  nucleic acid-binding Zn-ribbon protein
MNIAFDTLEYSEKLKAVGFSPEQAKVQAQALRDAMVEHVATKSDVDTQGERLEAKIERLEAKIEAQGKELEARINNEIALLREEFRSEILLVRRDMRMLLYQLIGSIGSMIVIAIGVVSKLAGLF